MSNRRVQHREKRDTNTRENAGLKKEVEKLKRQVARLKKELSHAESPEEPVEEDDNEEPRPTCPECGSDKLTEITTPSGSTRYACRGCKKWRGTLSL